MNKNENKKHDIFFISPVNGISVADESNCRSYIGSRVDEGMKIYFPLDDTKQDGDFIGNRICDDNLKAIRESETVDLYLAKSSKGSFFDLGASFYLDKLLYIVNPESLSSEDDMDLFIMNNSINVETETDSILKEEFNDFNNRINNYNSNSIHEKNNKIISLDFTYDKPTLFKFGMLYASRKPFVFNNIGSVEKTVGKSFQNLAHHKHIEFAKNYQLDLFD